MSNYRNIEINLLPPELMPPPAVRTLVILNIAIALGVLAYMALSTFTILGQIRAQREQIAEAEQIKAAKQPVVAMYTDLQAVHEQVDKYGRLVSLASVDYIDVPVLLDRLAKLIPAGVYLNRVSNDKPGANTVSTIVQVDLMTTQDDPRLMQATLDAFKGDSIFHDCFLRNAKMNKESISTQLPQYGINWNASGPDVPQSLDVTKYEFIVMANVPKLADTSGLPISYDQSIYLADVEFKTPPPPAEEAPKHRRKGKGKDKEAKADTQAPEHGSANAPEGVKPVGVN
jgi:hypothetical protein